MNNVLELFGTISLDTSGYEKGIKNSGKQAEEFGKKLDAAGKSSDAAEKKFEGVGTSADEVGSATKLCHKTIGEHDKICESITHSTPK